MCGLTVKFVVTEKEYMTDSDASRPITTPGTKNIFTDELALTGGLLREKKRELYTAASNGDLDEIKKLLPSYTLALRGAIFSDRDIESKQLNFIVSDILTLGQNEGLLEKALPEERLTIYRKAKDYIDQYQVKYPGVVGAELKAASEYVNLAANIYNSRLGNTKEEIVLAREILANGVAIYDKNPDSIVKLKDISELPLPEIAETYCTEPGKRYLRNQAREKELINLCEESLNDINKLNKANHTSTLHYAKTILEQPAELLFIEPGVSRALCINNDLNTKEPVIGLVSDGWQNKPRPGYAIDDEHKGTFKAILAQKDILDYLKNISKDDPIAQAVIAQSYSAFASEIAKNSDFKERSYADAAFSLMKEAINLYKSQPESAKYSNQGISLLYAISDDIADMYDLRKHDYVKHSELLDLFAEGRSLFPVDPADKSVILGSESGPTRLLQNTARILIKEKKYHEAIPLLEKSIRDNAHAPDKGHKDSDHAEREYGPYDLLAYAYNQTGKAEKAVPLLTKLRDDLVSNDLKKAQYHNQQIDVASLLRPFGYDIPAGQAHIKDKNNQRKVEEALGKTGFMGMIEHLGIYGGVSEFVDLSRKIIKAQLVAGALEDAKKEYTKVKELVNGLDIQVQKSDVDAPADTITELQYEVTRTSRYFADLGVEADLVKIGSKSEGHFVSKVTEKLDDIPAKLADATYIEEKYSSPKLKHEIRGMYRQLWNVPELQPILTAASLGVEGKLRGEGKFGVIFTREGMPGTHGFYAMRNLVQIAMSPEDRTKGLLDKENISRMRDILIHETTHYITQKLYNNDCKPYPGDNEQAKQDFQDTLRPDILKAQDYLKSYQKDVDNIQNEQSKGDFGSAQASVMRTFAQGGYNREQRDGEFIVRIPQGLASLAGIIGAKHSSKLFQETLPNAYRHFKEVFTPDLKKMIESIAPSKNKEINAISKNREGGFSK